MEKPGSRARGNGKRWFYGDPPLAWQRRIGVEAGDERLISP